MSYRCKSGISTSSHQAVYAAGKYDIAMMNVYWRRLMVGMRALPIQFLFLQGLTWKYITSPYWPGTRYVLVDMDKAPYEPVEGMVEILESEYEKLYAAIKN